MRAVLVMLAVLVIGSDALGVGPVRTKIQQKRVAKAAPKSGSCGATVAASARPSVTATASSCAGGSCPAPTTGIFGGK